MTGLRTTRRLLLSPKPCAWNSDASPTQHYLCINLSIELYGGYGQVSVGRLGIVTQLTLNILPQQSVRRAEQDMTITQFAQQVKQVQDAYTQAKQSGSFQAVWTALHSLNETQVNLCCACTTSNTDNAVLQQP